MARMFCVPGVIFLLAALVLQVLVSVSLPYLTGLDIARTTFPSGATAGQTPQTISELRFGVWSYCYKQAQSGDFACSPKHHGYSVPLSGNGGTQTIGSSWTRGLLIHPIAAGIIGVAFLLSLSEHLTVSLFASLWAFFGAFMTLVAFACDIALFAYLKKQTNNLNVNHSTRPGPGFWMTLASFIVLLLAGCTVCFGRRQNSRRSRSGATTGASSSAYPLSTGTYRPWYKRGFSFRR